MTYISPGIQPQFDTMPDNLKQDILARDLRLERMEDLMALLEQIVQEG